MNILATTFLLLAALFFFLRIAGVLRNNLPAISVPASLTSKIPPKKSILKTVFWIVVVSIIVLGVIRCVGPGVQYATDRTESFGGNSVESFRGYNIEGNYKIENNALHILGTCVITRKTNADQPWIAFDASGGGLVEVDILDNNLPDYGYDNFKSGQIVITKSKRRYLFTVKGDFYRLYIDGKLAEEFGIAEGGRRGRERTYKVTIKSVTPEGVWIDNIESK